MPVAVFLLGAERTKQACSMAIDDRPRATDGNEQILISSEGMLFLYAISD